MAGGGLPVARPMAKMQAGERVTRKQLGPRRWLPDTAPESTSNGYHNSSSRYCQAARCELHGVNLVHRFPPRCPLSTPNPLATLARLQDAAQRVIGRGVCGPEQSDALALLDATDTCLHCLDRILPHPTVRRLLTQKAAVA